MRATLSVELPWTELGDFAAHLEYELRVPGNDLLGHVAHVLWDLEKSDTRRIATSQNYYRVRPQITHAASRNWQISMASDGKTESMVCIILALQFRRDRLRITVVEREPSKVYRERMIEWLTKDWGDDVPDFPLENAPREWEADSMPELPAKAKPEDWTRFWNWYYREGRAAYSTLRDVAKLTGKSLSRVKTAHAKYLAENAIDI